MIDLLDVLGQLRPCNTISFKEGGNHDIANVVWNTQTTYSKGTDVTGKDVIWNEDAQLYTVSPFTIPSLSECETYWNDTRKYEKYIRILRQKRNILISKTDYLATIDYPHTSESKKQEWLDYRQALRDLPANTEDPENPVWPTPPE